MENQADELYKKIYVENYDKIVEKYNIQNVKKIEFCKNYDFEILSESKKVLYKYLENIDNMCLNLQNLDSKVPIISEDIKNLKIDTQKNEGELNDIKRFKDKLENYKHLEDIDKIWNDLDYLRVIKNKLEIVENLDKLTNDVEGLKKLNSSLELRLKNTFNFIEEQKKKIENLETNLETSQNENKSLSKKLNISYLLGGGALILSIFNTFYLFFRG